MPAKSFCATETYSYFSLGQIGVGLLDRVDLVPASEPLSPAANWILKGATFELSKRTRLTRMHKAAMCISAMTIRSQHMLVAV